MSGGLRVFTIAPGEDFAVRLAQGLVARLPGDALALSDTPVFLPTRRAARGFGDAFARVLGGAALLPSFQPLGDADEDGFDAAAENLLLPPAMARLRRQLLLANLIRQWDSHRDQALSFAQAAALADSLAQVMDEVETQGCDLGRLKEMLPAELAEHWEGVVRFLDVIQDQWPAILAAEKTLNPAARRNAMLEALARRLETAPPRGPVIAAGSTGSIPATAALLKVIAALPQGAVVLPGLDRALDDKSWADLDPGHPQYGLKQLLDTIGVAREAVQDWHLAPAYAPREVLLSEALRPAPITQAWRALAESGADMTGGTAGMALMLCADPAEEALSIALALRHALETPERTAALITPDRTLARRVAGELTRWGIRIDDSAGRPLAHTAVGGFLCLLAEAAAARFAPVPLLALLKHPFATLGQDAAQFRARTRELDRWCLRGPRPDPGLAGIANAIEKAGTQRRAPPADARTRLASWWAEVAALLRPLEMLQAKEAVSIGALLDAHIAAAEALACETPDACVLWRNADGEAANALVKELGPAAEGLAPIEPDSWPALLRHLAMKTAVRSAIGRHPRLAILGPLEARLQRFDLTVLGGLNEGTWPGVTGADPWFSRPMRASLGLEQPERRIGLSAHDFAMFAAAPQLLLTRAAKQDGAPTVASRWLQRLEQLLLGLQPQSGDRKETLAALLPPEPDFPALARRMMAVPQGARLVRPAPRPPVAVRPRRLSITEIETWLRDPYAIYARHVLKLEPLAPLDEPVGARERGTALHKALERFLLTYPDGLPDDAPLQLAALADTAFAEMGIPKGALAVWRPRFLAAAQALVKIEAARRETIARSFAERRGTLTITAPGGDFILSGRADRIDVLKSGGAVVMDYKSGRAPSRKQVEQLLSPQLPLEAAMLATGGFAEIGVHAAEALIYLGLFDKEADGEPLDVDVAALAEKAVAQLTARVRAFDQPGVGYAARLMPYRSDSEGDYDHLARVREWSNAGGGE